MVVKFMSVLKKFHNKVKTFRFLFTLSKADNSFCSFSKKKWKSNSENNIKGEVIIDILWCDEHIFQLSYIANYFYINHDLIPKYFQKQHLSPVVQTNWVACSSAGFRGWWWCFFLTMCTVYLLNCVWFIGLHFVFLVKPTTC